MVLNRLLGLWRRHTPSTRRSRVHEGGRQSEVDIEFKLVRPRRMMSVWWGMRLLKKFKVMGCLMWWLRWLRGPTGAVNGVECPQWMNDSIRRGFSRYPSKNPLVQNIKDRKAALHWFLLDWLSLNWAEIVFTSQTNESFLQAFILLAGYCQAAVNALNSDAG